MPTEDSKKNRHNLIWNEIDCILDSEFFQFSVIYYIYYKQFLT